MLNKYKTQFWISLSVILLMSCSMNIPTSLEAGRSGFTPEYDEPSARGQLIRISPEKSNVQYRFCLSPDKTKIVFSGGQSKGSDKLRHLWKISANGNTAPIKITSGGSKNIGSPSYTNDGKYIVYSSEGDIWKIRSDGAGGKGKIPGSGMGYDTYPSVSSKDRLTFCSFTPAITGKNKEMFLIWTSNLNGGELTQLREGKFPRWSPNGDNLTFEYEGDIWTINADGRNLMQLTNTFDISESLPSYSPDGMKIVFVSNEGNNSAFVKNDFNIWLMNRDGSNLTQITELDAWDSWPIWGENNIYFLSGRAKNSKEFIQRIWKLNLL